VPFQCRKVWKDILFSLGLLSLIAVLLRSAPKVFLSPCLLGWNTWSFILGMRFNIALSFLLIGNILGLLPFSAVMCIVPLSKSRSFHCML